MSSPSRPDPPPNYVECDLDDGQTLSAWRRQRDGQKHRGRCQELLRRLTHRAGRRAH